MHGAFVVVTTRCRHYHQLPRGFALPRYATSPPCMAPHPLTSSSTPLACPRCSTCAGFLFKTGQYLNVAGAVHIDGPVGQAAPTLRALPPVAPFLRAAHRPRAALNCQLPDSAPGYLGKEIDIHYVPCNSIGIYKCNFRCIHTPGNKCAQLNFIFWLVRSPVVA